MSRFAEWLYATAVTLIVLGVLAIAGGVIFGIWDPNEHAGAPHVGAKVAFTGIVVFVLGILCGFAGDDASAHSG